MITKVINASYCGVNINKFSPNLNNKQTQKITALNTDTVSFSGTPLQALIDETVALAFKKIQNLPFGFQMRSYKGVTRNNINVGIQETGFANNNAILTLTNGKFKNKNYALFELRSEYKQPSKIISLDRNDTKIDENYVKMINEILKDLK